MKVQLIKVLKDNEKVVALRVESSADEISDIRIVTRYQLRIWISENNYRYLSPEGWIEEEYELTASFTGKEDNNPYVNYFYLSDELWQWIEPDGALILSIDNKFQYFLVPKELELLDSEVLWESCTKQKISENYQRTDETLGAKDDKTGNTSFRKRPVFFVILSILLIVIAGVWFSQRTTTCGELKVITVKERAIINQEVVIRIEQLAKEEQALSFVSCEQSAKGEILVTHEQFIQYRGKQEGDDTVTCLIKNSCGKTAQSTIHFSLKAVDISKKITESRQLTVNHDFLWLFSNENEKHVDILGNDYSKNGEALTILSCDGTEGLRVENNEVIYIRQDAQKHRIAAKCTIRDSQGIEGISSLMIDVEAVNPLFKVNPDKVTLLPKQESITINILQNDINLDGHHLTVESCEGIDGLRIKNNKVVYHRQTGVAGQLVGQCRIMSSEGQSDTAELLINITTQPLKVKADKVVLAADKMQVIIDILANDQGGEHLHIKSCESAENWTVSNNRVIFQRPPVLGLKHDKSITCEVSDESGAVIEHQVTVVVKDLVLPLKLDRRKTQINLRYWLQQQTGWHFNILTCIEQNLPSRGVQFNDGQLIYDINMLDTLADADKTMLCTMPIQGVGKRAKVNIQLQ